MALTKTMELKTMKERIVKLQSLHQNLDIKIVQRGHLLSIGVKYRGHLKSVFQPAGISLYK